MANLPPSVRIIELARADAVRISRLHAAAFPANQAWVASQFESLLGQANVHARAITDKSDLLSILIVQIAADQAEILTLATAPHCRQQGHAARLLMGVEGELINRGFAVWLLDVAEDNEAAIKFYTRTGFQVDGRRRGYYKRLEGKRVDAILMSKPMARQAAN
nr:N-acetyltransferase [Hyphomonas sp. Mor2]